MQKSISLTLKFLVIGMLLLLPFSIKLTNLIIIAILILSLLSTSLTKIFKKLYEMRLMILINITPFTFIIFSLLFSKNFQVGLTYISKYFPLLIFPVLVPLLPIKTNDCKVFLRVFILPILGIGLISIGSGITNFFSYELDPVFVGDNYNRIYSPWNALTNEVLLSRFDIDPIYLSLYISFGFFAIMLDDSLNKYLRALMALFLLTFLLLIGSRVGFLAFLLAVFFIMILMRARKIFWAISITVLMTALLAILINPVLKKRYVNDMGSMLHLPHEVSGWNGANIRSAVWICSYEAFLKKPILGYGVGSQSYQREKCYKNYSFYPSFGTDFNSHNQFIEYALIGGIILVLLFLLQLGFSFSMSIKANSKLHTVFVLLFFTFCLAESVLERHKGLVFFSFFNSLFIFWESDIIVRSSKGNFKGC